MENEGSVAEIETYRYTSGLVGGLAGSKNERQPLVMAATHWL